MKKRRNAVKISQSAYEGNINVASFGNESPGGSGANIGQFFSDLVQALGQIDKRIWLAVGAGVIALGLLALFIVLGATGACSSCSSCGSCGSCSSCKDESKEYSASLNSGGNSVWYKETLYYASTDGVYCRKEDGSGYLLTSALSPTALSADGGYVYFIENGSLWRTPFEKPITVSPGDTRSALRLVDPSAAVGGVKLASIDGYYLDGNELFYWGSANGLAHIFRRELNAAGADLICAGDYSFVGMYRGKLFAADSSGVWRIDTESGKLSAAYEGSAAKNICFSDGFIFIYINDETTSILTKVSIEKLKVVDQWQFAQVSSMLANDELIYYCVNSSDGGELYSMTPEGEELHVVFTDPGTVELLSISGDTFSVSVSSGESRCEYIFNYVTRQQLVTVKK